MIAKSKLEIWQSKSCKRKNLFPENGAYPESFTIYTDQI